MRGILERLLYAIWFAVTALVCAAASLSAEAFVLLWLVLHQTNDHVALAVITGVLAVAGVKTLRSLGDRYLHFALHEAVLDGAMSGESAVEEFAARIEAAPLADRQDVRREAYQWLRAAWPNLPAWERELAREKMGYLIDF